jgi:Virulence protein RhuM family
VADPIVSDSVLLESRSMRASHLDRDTVLDRVGTLALAGDSSYALTEHVAAYFGTTEGAIEQLVKRNREEMKESGYRSLTGDDLREFKDRYTDVPMSRAARLAVFTRRAVLNVAMLMEGNDVAKAVRTYLLNVEELADDEVKRTALARAKERMDFKHFRDIMSTHGVDYAPSDPASNMAFAQLQNIIYKAVLGMTAQEILDSGRPIQSHTGKTGPRKADLRVAKNYLTGDELERVGRRVALMCLHAEIAAEDGKGLTLGEWLQAARAWLKPRALPA